MKQKKAHNSRRKAPQSARQMAMRRFRQNKTARFAIWLISILVTVAVFADFLANEKPIYAVYQGKTYFPVIKDYLHDLGISKWDGKMIRLNWKKTELEAAVWPPVRYGKNEADPEFIGRKSPFDDQGKSWKEWHYLGTTNESKDVLSVMIHGTRVSLTIGILAMGVAGFIGILLGSIAGYYGDDRMRISRIQMLLLFIGIPFAWFYAFQARSITLKDAAEFSAYSVMGQLLLSLIMFVGILVALYQFGRLFRKIPFLGTKRPLPLDLIISRLAELVSALPAILVLVTLFALMDERSNMMIFIAIGFISWPGIYRFTRGEMLRIRNLEYIKAAQSLGLPDSRIMIRHALPNAMSPILTVFAFGIASSILAESALSFLFPQDAATWGELLSGALGNKGWWLAVFPGFAIFVTVTLFNLLGEGLRDAIDPRMKV